MLKRAHEQVSSPGAIEASILYDSQVSLWVEMLMKSAKLTQELKRGTALSPAYKRWRFLRWLQQILIILMPWAAMFFLWRRQGLALGIAVLFWILALILEKIKRKTLSQIFLALLRQSFPPEKLTQQSLYQISEELGRYYQVPGLVAVVYAHDSLSRLTLVTLVIFFIFLSLMNGPAAAFLAALCLFIFFQLALKLFFIQKVVR